jgi:anaerobic selenocysteine-containing dehydrogenase
VSSQIENPWGERTPFPVGGDWPIRVDEHTEAAVEDWVQSACVLCSNGCGIDIGVRGGRIVGVRGRAVDRVNHGRLGPKGLNGWQANNAADRLRRPLVRRDGELREATWDDAMELVAAKAREQLATRGPGAVGFYTSGQLFLEDYYTLALVARAGIGTNHLDGNTRLCTATAGQALKETFGCDGQPGTFADIDLCDTLLHVGINMAETQTVTWMRHLDRLDGRDRPRLVAIDPRSTMAARAADVHLAVKSGTNVAILNALLRELIENDWLDRAWIDAHTIGFDALATTVEPYTPEYAGKICAVDPGLIREAGRLLGTAERLLSFVLQGVYQSHQATAAACQVNNINLLRGMIGKPGCGILQMNGQPTAQNTRETGANGDLPAFRNWQNEAHVAELAQVWNVDPLQIPHWGPPTHAMEIFRYCEEGSIGFLWITATNPAVSLPELARIREILRQERLFVVVSDAFLTETAELADVVLPAAIWGEKTGTFTNADRTVHLSEKAVDPPGEARPELEVFIEFAHRLELRDRDGQPLVKWSTPEGAYRAWQQCSAGRPCDYTEIGYDALRGGSGIQWGGERLYEDGRFPTHPDYAEDYGHDVLVGNSLTESEYKALNPQGRAILKSATWSEPHEWPDDDYPLVLNTGRTVYHFHTRTKTGRAPELAAAAPEVWIELARGDAARLGISEGDLCEISSPRGTIQAPARVSGIREGVAFVPFHYGDWDRAPTEARHAANELTITQWDPVSKQPIFKTGKVRVTKLADADRQPSSAPSVGASAPVGAA